MAQDLTSFEPALKERYTPDRLKDESYKNNPFLASRRKFEDFQGDELPIPLRYGNPQGRSATFSKAKSNKTSVKLKGFKVTRSKDYCLADVDGETIAATASDVGAFARATVVETDGAFNSISNMLAHDLFQEGSGTLGQIEAGATVAATSIPLEDDNDIVHFEVGMTLVLADAKSGGSLRNSGATIQVTSVDRDNAKVGFAANLTASIAAAAAGDYFVADGDYDSKIKGLAAWIPSTVTATTFFGVDRTVDTIRLGGIRFNASGYGLVEGIKAACARVAREGGKPTSMWVSYDQWINISNALEGQKRYGQMKADDGRIGFDTLILDGPTGPIDIVPDRSCQTNIGWLLQDDTWEIASVGTVPRVLDWDNAGKWLRNSDADSIEFRTGYYAQLVCDAPGWNARITLPS